MRTSSHSGRARLLTMLMGATLLSILALLAGAGHAQGASLALSAGKAAPVIKLLPPTTGVYQAAYASNCDVRGCIGDGSTITQFEQQAGKGIVWDDVADPWTDGIHFPTPAVETIWSRGAMPYIRILPLSIWSQAGTGSCSFDNPYSMQNIINGDYDAQIRAYADAARDTGIPMLIAFGGEMNGGGFPWRGECSGAGTTDGHGDPSLADGPERFRDAYRHFIDLFREEGANNITWVMQYDIHDWPAESWNTMAAYYPGDDYIDWIGASVYGAQRTADLKLGFNPTFRQAFDPQYPELSSVSPSKPIAISEWGVDLGGKQPTQAEFISGALADFASGRWPRVKAVSYWNSNWDNGSEFGWSYMRLDSDPLTEAAYRAGIANPAFTSQMNFGSPAPPLPARQPLPPAAKPLDLGPNWAGFGYSAARSNAGPVSTGITAANVGKLQRQQVQLDGTVDSSPIYLKGVTVSGSLHDVFIVTTASGQTEAIDASTGMLLWKFTPPGYSSWALSGRITKASPVADPSGQWVYAASPDGEVNKISVSDGQLVWSALVSKLPAREEIVAALNYWEGRVIVTTAGYAGRGPAYQGHVVTIDSSDGQVDNVWNALCSAVLGLLPPSACTVSGSGIFGGSGAVVVPASGDLLVATGSGYWDGKQDWSNSVLELSPDGSRLISSWTPSNWASLSKAGVSIGTSSPVLLASSLLVQGGSDGKLRMISLTALTGPTTAGAHISNVLQTVSTPGGAPLSSVPATNQGWLWVADGSGTAAWRLSDGRLRPRWTNSVPGTSPVFAGGLLYVYNPAGGLYVYNPQSGKRVAVLATGKGDLNSPIISDGRIALPEGNANAHAGSGLLDIFRVGH